MFKQVKSAVFWYYLYKFRKRVVLIALLLIVAIFANAIHSDIIEYLKLKDKLLYLEVVLLSKWFLILFNLTFSVYLILTMFKKEENIKEEKQSIFKKKVSISDDVKEEPKKQQNSKEKFSEREKQFLYKKKLKNKADQLVEK